MNEKFNTLEEAIIFAEFNSKKYSRTVFVIESQGKFYTDESGFVRIWEELHCTYKNGKELQH